MSAFDGVEANKTTPSYDYETEAGHEFEQGNVTKKINDGAWGKVAAIDGNTLSIIFKGSDNVHIQ